MVRGDHVFFGFVMFFLLGIAIGITGTERHVYRQAIERGYVIYHPETGVRTWKDPTND